MKIITRAEAKKLGLKRYFTGKACKRGHISERRVNGSACLHCQIEKSQTDEYKESRKLINKKYEEKNKEKIKERKKIYRIKNKESISMKNKEYRNRPEIKARTNSEEYRKKKSISDKKWRDNNKEYKSFIDKKYREENKEKCDIRRKKYYEANKKSIQKRQKEWTDKIKNKTSFKLKRFTRNSIRRIVDRAKEKKHLDSTKYIDYTALEFKEHIEALFRDGMTWDNHGSVWHIDHIIPLSWYTKLLKGHSQEIIMANANELQNLQPLLIEENLRKGDKMPWNCDVGIGNKNVKAKRVKFHG